MGELGVAIRVQDLYKSYRSRGSLHRALSSVSFEVSQGEIFVVLGPNGAGKTSLIEVLEGLAPFDKGRVEVLGFSPGSSQIRALLGVSLEEASFRRDMTVRHILRFYGSFYKEPADVDELLLTLNLKEKEEAPFRSLSKGMKQKLSLGVALINNPKIVFLDEPNSGLDVETRRNIGGILRNLKEKGVTLILTTHDMREASLLADRVCLLTKGQIVQIGTVEELLGNFPASSRVEYEGELVEDASIVKGFSDSYRHILYTNNPEKLVSCVEKRGGRHVLSNPVSLEDIYFYYTRTEG